MNRITFPGKRLSDTVILPFDATSQLAVGETIASVNAVACVVYWGVDPNPSAVLGAHSISGNIVNVFAQSGVLGTIYYIACNVLTSLGQSIDLVGALAIIPDIQ